MTESALRCCLHISSVSCGSAACDCAGRAGLNSSSRWQRSLRTSAGWPSSWHGRLRSRPHAWRERQVTPKARWQSLEWSPATALTGEWQAKLVARRQGPLSSSATSATKSANSRPEQVQQMVILFDHLIGTAKQRDGGVRPSVFAVLRLSYYPHYGHWSLAAEPWSRTVRDDISRECDRRRPPVRSHGGSSPRDGSSAWCSS